MTAKNLPTEFLKTVGMAPQKTRTVGIKWTPHPVIVAIKDAGWGGPPNVGIIHGDIPDNRKSSERETGMKLGSVGMWLSQA